MKRTINYNKRYASFIQDLHAQQELSRPLSRPYSSPSRLQLSLRASVTLHPPIEEASGPTTDRPSSQIFNPVHHIVYPHCDGSIQLPVWSFQVEGNIWGEEWQVITLDVLTEAVMRAHKPWDKPVNLQGLEERIEEELFGPEGLRMSWEDLPGAPLDHCRMKVLHASSITEIKHCLNLGLNNYPDGVYYVSFIFEPWRGRNTIVALEFLLRRDL